MGDPIGAAAHIRQSLADDGSWMIVEPFANDNLKEVLSKSICGDIGTIAPDREQETRDNVSKFVQIADDDRPPATSGPV
jgi:hypothetical protein